jgi:hypothetical protein
MFLLVLMVVVADETWNCLALTGIWQQWKYKSLFTGMDKGTSRFPAISEGVRN